jgi:hypothetical protein
MCSFIIDERRFAILRYSAGNKRFQIVVILESKYNRSGLLFLATVLFHLGPDTSELRGGAEKFTFPAIPKFAGSVVTKL